MNIDKIKQIIKEDYPNDVTEHLIIKAISEDENVVPLVMKIIEAERKRKKELQVRMNLELSRAQLGLEKPEINTDHFMDKSIQRFYLLNKDQVGHCFKDLRNIEISKEEKELEQNSIFGKSGYG